MIKRLYRFESEARAAFEKLGVEGRESTCDAENMEEIMDDELQKGGACGETKCLRSDEGDIIAWWEDDE